MTDGVFNAAIYDVVVHQDFQRQGIAKKLWSLLDKLSNVSCIYLISTTGNEEFYRKLGLKKLKTGMGRYLNPNLSDEFLVRNNFTLQQTGALLKLIKGCPF